MARINLGIRRRLAPLMEGDRRRVELMNSLLLSMPGTPIVYYGDELGMGDNIHLGDRNGVRTPMQWSADRNGGFSRADPERLQVPVLMGPLYGHEVINVEAQHRNPHSLLNWTRRLLACRARTPAFGRGSLTFLPAGNRKILAYLRQWADTSILCVANLSASAQAVELPLQDHEGAVPVEMLAGSSFPRIGQWPYLLTLPPYGFYWFELSAEAAPPDWHVEIPVPLRELVTLVLRNRHPHAFGDAARRLFETEALPAYLALQRWSVSGRPAWQIREMVPHTVPDGQGGPGSSSHYWILMGPADGGVRRLNVPVTLCWNEDQPPGYPIARIRCGPDTGWMADAFQEADFLRTLVENLRTAPQLACGGEDAPASGSAGLLCRRFAEAWAPLAPEAGIRWIGGEQSNSSAIVDEQVVVKILRQVEPGQNVEIVMSRWLTQAGYANTPALLGTVAYQDGQGERTTLAVLHRYVPNEGDAWRWTLAFLQRTLAAALLVGNDAGAFENSLSGYLALAQRMGRRLAELHAVFVRPQDALSNGPPAARASRAAEVAADGSRALQALAAALDALARLPPAERAPLQESVAFLAAQRDMLSAWVDDAVRRVQRPLRLHVHGDLHLGQILVSHADAYLIDFEGEPLHDAARRQAPATIYKDLAGMLRSFDYAAAVALQETAVPTVSEVPAVAPAGPGSPLTPGEPVAASPDALIAAFRVRAGAAFMAGYREARPEELALDGGSEDLLLTIAQLEKAAYEVRYEATHRPGWLPIPVHALVRIVRSLIGPGAVPAGERP
jgi:maltose alpha-D-glucosyltransferase/alpha-amylase